MEKKEIAKEEGQKTGSGFSFKFHLMLFVLTIGMLFIINLAFTPFLWVLYPLFSWLIAINLHLTAIITKKLKNTMRTLLGHVSIYLSVNLLLGVIDYISSGALTWFLYPLFFWGVGVLLHAIIYSEFLAKKPPRVGESKMKLKLKEKFPQLDLSKARSKREKLLSATSSSTVEKPAPKKKGRIKPPKELKKPKGRQKEKDQDAIDISEEDKKEIEKTELEMDIEEKEVFCIVHKGPIVGTVYICPQCKTYYCFKCANTLKKNDETCWSCDAVLNP